MAKIIPAQNNKVMRSLRPLVKLQFGIERYTPEVVDFFVKVLQESSALCIQAAWRGYVTRKKYATLQEQLRREKAAVAIQRFVREWLYKRKTEELLKSREKEDRKEKPIKLTAEEVEKIIADWRTKHNIYRVVVPENEDEIDRDIERRMKQFYMTVEISNRRAIKVDRLYTSIDNELLKLSDITSLFEKDESEIKKHGQTTRKMVTRGHNAVQQNLRYMNAPWWKKIEYELSDNYGDVHLPSEVDACKQFMEEKREN